MSQEKPSTLFSCGITDCINGHNSNNNPKQGDRSERKHTKTLSE